MANVGHFDSWNRQIQVALELLELLRRGKSRLIRMDSFFGSR
jgi:hypothetical protein